ncbi:MAG TPA: carbamoyltransferase C-terminal domain-containing protein, partial [Elusimicrobiota bacterium]|nr:carbamoyltransferase C-terminal domain-containing protein [Elusimicrobiota bacterium]
TDQENSLFGIDKLNAVRSTIPAVTHIDYSARVQTVDQDRNPLFYKLLRAFERQTGFSVIINTSFNVRGEPIVCTPAEAYVCFMRTDMDYLVLGNFLLKKTEQKPLEKDIDWRSTFELD